MARICIRCLVMLVVAAVVEVPVVARADEAKSETPNAVSQPASRPASEIVLAKVGPTVITQEDFNKRVASAPRDRVKQAKSIVLKKMIGERKLLLYTKDNPDLVDKAKLDAAVEEVMRKEGAKSREELEAKLKSKGKLEGFHDFLDMKLTVLGRAALVAQGEKRADDENVLREVFEKNPSHFDGSRVRVRHILVETNAWDSPEVLKAKWDKIAQIRQDILAGRRTWEECVEQSDDLGTRAIGGDRGLIPRHLETTEAFAKAAFETKQGEISEVFESPTGYHILQVTGEHKGNLKFEDAKVWIRLFVMQEKVIEADKQANAKYQVVGVREPDMPPPLPPKPPVPSQPTAATRPAKPTRPPQVTRPGAASRPSPIPPGNRSVNRPSPRKSIPASRPTATRPAQVPAKK